MSPLNLYGYILLTYTVLLATGAFTLSVLDGDPAFALIGGGLMLLALITGIILMPRTET